MSEKVHVILNPKSAGGATAHAAPEIFAALQQNFSTCALSETTGPRSAVTLTRQALQDGATLVFSVGGDGTLNEVVNGFFDGDKLVSPDARLSVLPFGTGSDFRKTLGISDDWRNAITTLGERQTRMIDLGKITFQSRDGQKTTWLFDNIASFGIGGIIADKVNRATFAKKFGGRFAFTYHTLTTALTYRPQMVHLKVDDTFDRDVATTIIAICNGRYFGGGMEVAPGADIEDGLFEIVILEDMSPLDFFRSAGLLYEAGHVDHPKVTILKGRNVTVTSLGTKPPLPLEIDGETPGFIDAQFSIKPKVLPMLA